MPSDRSCVVNEQCNKSGVYPAGIARLGLNAGDIDGRATKGIIATHKQPALRRLIMPGASETTRSQIDVDGVMTHLHGVMEGVQVVGKEPAVRDVSGADEEPREKAPHAGERTPESLSHLRVRKDLRQKHCVDGPAAHNAKIYICPSMARSYLIGRNNLAHNHTLSMVDPWVAYVITGVFRNSKNSQCHSAITTDIV